MTLFEAFLHADSSSVGMQHYVIPSEQPYGLGLDEKLMPEYLKSGKKF